MLINIYTVIKLVKCTCWCYLVFKGDIDNILALLLSPSITFRSRQGCCSKYTFSEVAASLLMPVNVS